MTDYEEMNAILGETANAIYRMDSNPSSWTSWLVYLLDRLEQKSNDSNPVHKEVYNDMLETLINRIRNRQRTGGW